MNPLVIRIAKALYNDDRKRKIAAAKDANRTLRRDSYMRLNERRPTWGLLCKQGGFLGEHPRDRYIRYAETAVKLAGRRGAMSK